MRQNVCNHTLYAFKVILGWMAIHVITNKQLLIELLSNLVFEIFGSCGGLIVYVGFYAVSELDAGDDFDQIVEAA